MMGFHVITLLMVLRLSPAISDTLSNEIESVSAACSNPTDCAINVAQLDSTGSSADTPETKSVEAVSEKLESVSNPLGKASKSIESISKPIKSVSKPLDSVSEPLSSVSQPIGVHSNPANSDVVPVDSLKDSQGSESKIEEEKEELGASSISPAQRGRGDIGNEPLAVGGKNDSSDSEGGFEELFEESENVGAIEQDYDRIKGTRGTYCKWTDENGMIHIESGEKCIIE